MAEKALSENGLLYFWQALKGIFARKATEVPADVTRTASDATFVAGDKKTALFYLRQATTTLAGLMTAADKQALEGKADKSSQSITDDTAHSTDYDYTKGKKITIATSSGAQNVDVVPHSIVYGSPSNDNVNNERIPTWEGVMQWVFGKNYAPKASPEFTGTPTAPTPSAGTSNNQIATTQFVRGLTDGLSKVEVSQISNGTILNVNGTDYTVVSEQAPTGNANQMIAPSWDAMNNELNKKVPTTRKVNGHALTADVTVTKSDVSLGNVTNDAQVKRSEMGVANGVATLGSDGKVPASQLPSYVDDVIEVYGRSGVTSLSAAAFSLTDGGTALTPETGKIYVLMKAYTQGSGTSAVTYKVNSQFRWSGSAYVPMFDGGVSWMTNAEIDAILAQ